MRLSGYSVFTIIIAHVLRWAMGSLTANAESIGVAIAGGFGASGGAVGGESPISCTTVYPQTAFTQLCHMRGQIRCILVEAGVQIASLCLKFTPSRLGAVRAPSGSGGPIQNHLVEILMNSTYLSKGSLGALK